MPASSKYPEEIRHRAVRMVFEWRQERGDPRGGCAQVARQLGINKETLRNWVNHAAIDEGRSPGRSSDDAAYIAQLERDNRELKRSNEILRSAAAFFARELDPRPPR